MPFAQCSVKQLRVRTERETSSSAPKIGHRRSQDRIKRTNVNQHTTRQGADLRAWVELRGFEPLTPSMRTRCATGLRYSPKTASQRSKRRDLFAPGDR